MAFCSGCGAQMADNVTFCPNCGKAAGQAAPAAGAVPPPPPPPVTGYNTTAAPSTPLEENIAGMLAYITIIPAIIFLLIEPYNRNRFVRFHCFQNLFFHVALIALGIAVAIIESFLHFIPFVGWIVGVVLVPIVWLGVFILWLLLLIKAYKHEMYKLPFIGDVAEKQAGV